MSSARAAAGRGWRPTQPLLDDGPPRVESIDPRDGASGVFCDACVMARLSSPADPETLSAETFVIEDHEGVVPARLRLSADRRVLVWIAARPLAPGVAHVVRLSGLRDSSGQELAPHRSQFVPCELRSTDWPG
jgi:hypothetical protein